MASLFLVTGGTGTLGRRVLPLLTAAGVEVRVVSRSEHSDDNGVEYMTGDVSTGDGLAAAMTGVHTVVHLAGSNKGDEEKARYLVRAASAAGVQHIVYISVVGADRVPVVSAADHAMFGYFAAKRGAEQVVADSGIPWTTLRATQFHDLVVTTIRSLSKSPVVPTFGGIRFQPVDSRDVAERLVEVALDEPAGLVTDIGGPRSYGMDELARTYLRAVGKRRLILPIKQPGRAARAMRQGANLTSDGVIGKRTWEDFLAEQAVS